MPYRGPETTDQGNGMVYTQLSAGPLAAGDTLPLRPVTRGSGAEDEEEDGATAGSTAPEAPELPSWLPASGSPEVFAPTWFEHPWYEHIDS